MKGLKRLQKRALALFMALVLCLSLLPATALAEEGSGAWKRLAVEDIQSLLGSEKTVFTAQELLNREMNGQKLVSLGLGTENVEPAAELTETELVASYTISNNAVVLLGSEEEDSQDDPSGEPETVAALGKSDGSDEPDEFEKTGKQEIQAAQGGDRTEDAPAAEGTGVLLSLDGGENDPAQPLCLWGWFVAAVPMNEENEEAEETEENEDNKENEEDGDGASQNSPARISESDNKAGDQMRVGSITYKFVNEQEIPIENDGEFPLHLTTGQGTPPVMEQMTVAVEVYPTENEKEFHILVPWGVHITKYITEKDSDYSEYVASSSIDRKTLPGDIHSPYSEKLTYTCTPECTRAVVRFDVGVEFGHWNGIAGNIVQRALVITNGSDETLFSADAEVGFHARGDHTDIKGRDDFWGCSGSAVIPTKKDTEFVWCTPCPLAGTSWRFHTSFTLTVDFPSVRERGKDTPTYAVPVKYPDDPDGGYTATVDEENHKIIVSGTNCYFTRADFSFQWDHDLDIDKTNTPSRYVQGNVALDSATIIGGERHYNDLYSGRYIPPDASFRFWSRGTTTRYNWHIGSRCEDVLYPVNTFKVKNSGDKATGNHLLSFSYINTDQVGVREQLFPVTGQPIAIRYKTTKQGDSWIEKTEMPSNGCVSAKWAGLADDEYFTAIQVIVPPYEALLAEYTDNSCWVKMLKEQAQMGEEPIPFWHGWMYNDVPESFAAFGGNDTAGTQVGEEAIASLQPSNDPNDSWASYYTGLQNGSIQAGEEKEIYFTYTPCYSHGYDGTSGYTYDPIFFLRLPKYLHLKEDSVYATPYGTVLGNEAFTVENAEEEIEEALGAGFEEYFEKYNIYMIRPQEGRMQGGSARDIHGDLTATGQWGVSNLHLHMTIEADRSARPVTLNGSDLFFIYNNEGGSRNPEITNGPQEAWGDLLWYDKENDCYLYTNHCAKGSSTLKVTAGNIPVTFEGEADDTENCTFLPDSAGGGTVYVSGDGLVTFTYTLTNPGGLDVGTGTLKHFSYDIPIFSAEDNENFSLVLDEIRSANNGLQFERRDGCVHVTYPNGSGNLASAESRTVQLVYRVEGIENAQFGQTLPINCTGSLVSPNGDRTKDDSIKMVFVVAGTASGRVVIDGSHGGAHPAEETPVPPSAKITAVNTEDPTDWQETTTDEKGEYILKALHRNASYQVTITHPDASASALRFITKDAGSFAASEDGKTASITVTADEKQKTLPVAALEAPHTVTFVVDGPEGKYTVTGDEAQKIWHGDKVTAWPTVEPITGYQRGSWTPAQDTPITQKTEFTIMVRDHLAKYTVEHYLENLEGGGYTLADTEPLDGRVGDPVTAQAKTYEGFTWDESAEGTLTSGTVAADDSLVLKLYYTRNEYQVKYEYTGEIPAGASALPETASYKYGAPVSVSASASAADYTFSGWKMDGKDAADFTMPAKDVTISGSFSQNAAPTSPRDPDPIVPDPTPTPRPTPVPDEPTPMDPGTDIDDEATPLAGTVGLNDVDHFAYIVGYDDNTVRPTNNITRAEVATIFFRLMEDDYRAANWSTENRFSDVSAGQWYNNAISTCEKAGALGGYEDGSFRPENPITRVEFAVIASRFLSEEYTDEDVGDFSDTANHWAAKEIRRAVKAGWITGDGNQFRPEDPITRAEVMTIVNRMLDRLPDAEHFLPDMIHWIDNPEGTWYYEAVQEATNEHDYERDELNMEIWTLLKPHRDWSALEKEWADAYAG